MKNNRNIYRALCEKNDKLCIVESKKIMTYEFFVKSLSAYKVTNSEPTGLHFTSDKRRKKRERREYLE